MSKEVESQPNVLGHPAGLYTLFFAEMWERFSYYGMRAILIFYMTKGLLGMNDFQASSIYGAYTSLVYMTPFIGGLLADRILGKRYAVILGGILMSAGHLLMTIESELPFYFALALLIVGNGFFKPNISTMVGQLYGNGDARRDNGFNIFYMGINLGAAISPLLCGYVGEYYGWHYGFGLATIGMMVGLAVFVMPNMLTAALIMVSAIATGVSLLIFRPDNIAAIGVNIFVAISLLASAVISFVALNRGGLPQWVGQRPENTDARHDWKVFVGVAVSIPIFAMLVSGFSPLMPAEENNKTEADLRAARAELVAKYSLSEEVAKAVNSQPIVVPAKTRSGVSLLSPSICKGTKELRIDDPKLVGSTTANEVLDGNGKAIVSAGQTLDNDAIARLANDGQKSVWVLKADDDLTSFGKFSATVLEEISKPAGLVLMVLGFVAYGYLLIEIFRLPWLYRDRMLAAMVLIFFNLLFFAFFEQAGNSMSLFTDRNVMRVSSTRLVTEDMVGTTVRIQPTQAQVGYQYQGQTFTLDDLDGLRKLFLGLPQHANFEVEWPLTENHVSMMIVERSAELPASIFQALNAVFILVFALVFNALWTWLQTKGLNPSAPVKFGLGLIQLGFGFYAMVYGAAQANEQGMVSAWWLVLAYYLHTTGELCLSPVGLSAMTKLSAKHLVSTLMGGWFLATGFSQYMAGIISQFAGAKGKAGDSISDVPSALATLETSASVFNQITWVAVGCGLLCLLLAPLIKYWMHENVKDDADGSSSKTRS
ncbi:MAG: MFS transporter [Planctomycetaceae bacterium]|nr:MFS transporter [Planctomycetaceae bacterium]